MWRIGRTTAARARVQGRRRQANRELHQPVAAGQEYRKTKEVYEAPLEVIKGVVGACGAAADARNLVPNAVIDSLA